MIKIVTGKIGSGKTSFLKNIKQGFDGVLTECEDRKKKLYKFNLIKANKKLLCCRYENGMMFNQENFDKVNAYLLESIKKNKKIIIDELGWLELENEGLYNSVKHIVEERNFELLYLSMRYDIYLKLIEKFEIKEFTLIDLTK